MGIWKSLRDGFGETIRDNTERVLAEHQFEFAEIAEAAVKEYDYTEYEPRNQTSSAPIVLGQFDLTAPALEKTYAERAKALMSNSVAKTCILMRATAIGNVDLNVTGSRAVKAMLARPNHTDGTLQNALKEWEMTLSIGGDMYLFYDNRLESLPQVHSFRQDFVWNDVQKRRYCYGPGVVMGKGVGADFYFYYDTLGRTIRVEERVGNTYQTIKGGFQHIKYFDPRTSTEGAGAGDSALRAIQVMAEIDAMLFRKFKAGGSKAGYFEIQGMPTDAEVETMRQQFQQLNPTGGANVLPGGVKFTAAQLTLAEMEILEARQAMATEICTAFNVPAELVNQSVATYANVRGKDKVFYRNCVQPEAYWLIGKLEAGIRAYIDPNAKLEIDETSVQHLEEDRREQAAKMAQMKCYTVNEVRAVQGYPPLSDEQGGNELVGASVNNGQPEEKPKGEVDFNADAGDRGDKNNEQ